MLFSMSRELWLSGPALVLVGFGMMLQMASSNTFLQTVVDDDKRGRVLSLYTMAYIGVAPIGSLLMGWIAEKIGAPSTLALGGAVTLVGAAIFGRNLEDFRAQVRPIYQRMGIIPEVATGIQAATQTTSEDPT
jgi:MFS family permease